MRQKSERIVAARTSRRESEELRADWAKSLPKKGGKSSKATGYKEKKKQEPIVLKKPKFGKVSDLNPDSKNVNVMVKCVKGPEAIIGLEGLYEAVVGDASGALTMSLKGEAQVSVCTVGASLRVQNARVQMVKGHLRLVADKWSAFAVATSTLDFEVNEKNDLSAMEYELVRS